jgi:hypothetical protein
MHQSTWSLPERPLLELLESAAALVHRLVHFICSFLATAWQSSAALPHFSLHLTSVLWASLAASICFSVALAISSREEPGGAENGDGSTSTAQIELHRVCREMHLVTC